VRKRVPGDISLPNIVAVMVETREAWSAFHVFAESVMLAKEEAKRQRKAALMEMGSLGGDGSDIDDESDPAV